MGAPHVNDATPLHMPRHESHRLRSSVYSGDSRIATAVYHLRSDAYSERKLLTLPEGDPHSTGFYAVEHSVVILLATD